jgi:hypothetical protein
VRGDDRSERLEHNDFETLVRAGTGALMALSPEAGILAGAADSEPAGKRDEIGIGHREADGGGIGRQRRGPGEKDSDHRSTRNCKRS